MPWCPRRLPRTSADPSVSSWTSISCIPTTTATAATASASTTSPSATPPTGPCSSATAPSSTSASSPGCRRACERARRPGSSTRSSATTWSRRTGTSPSSDRPTTMAVLSRRAPRSGPPAPGGARSPPAARPRRRTRGAGRRAFARGDMPAAANLLRRAATLLPEDDRDRLELLPELGEALIDTGEFAWAQIFLEEAVRHADDPRLAARARIVAVSARQHAADPTGWSEEAVREAREAVPIFERAGDDAGLAASYRLLASAHGTACRYGDAAAAAQAAVEHATAAGDDRQRRWASSQYAITATYGPTPVEQAVPHCEAILAQSDGDRRTEGLTMSLLARLEAMRGDFARARTLSSHARPTLEELGRSVVAASTSLDSCGVDLLAGDPAAAERHLRRDSEALSEMGETYLLSTVAAELARAVVLQGRDAEAEALTATAEELAAEDDIASQALWRSVRATVMARRGELRAARRMATEAVELLRRTDAAVTLADALVDLGGV